MPPNPDSIAGRWIAREERRTGRPSAMRAPSGEMLRPPPKGWPWWHLCPTCRRDWQLCATDPVKRETRYWHASYLPTHCPGFVWHWGKDQRDPGYAVPA